ncbi:membrane-associated guanylate kinase, WW and PDZ domain-containing protein 1 [Periophthalmus magnuspinnatus]|uniref:membrane-associated guanylate kinase, WW and PDZ domain-containing protein 1 n=1 Tax=Periophthalmus magnuspinnatus TaxID=409849 RepID=UPI00145A0F74|nr:membrane-associated guanylate kinase, WW and PDZ domain-containing protein 1 [Periophthalmus magnuspinnatus]XP_033826031.1 membrane-associated guanylate kinase, WW and PDZ domain-containing protein 1 [Periophthalmus magnuspinnatus]
MSKATVKKLHWRSKVQESFVPLGANGELGLAVGGGADYGEFPFVTAAPGGGATVGDIILEIGGTPILGMTLGDVRGVLNSCPQPIRIKTVSPGSSLCKDLRLYLSKCFTPGSMDSQLQQVIRENLYLRAVPCTTRQPREGEISGVDYNFVSIEEFFSLEESGALLESGKFKGNYYGTPRPVHIGPESPPITYQEHRNLLRNFRTRSKSLSNLEKAGEEDNSEEDTNNSGSAIAPPTTLPLSQSWESATGSRDSSEAGGRRRGGVLADNWDDPDHYFTDHNSKSSSWLEPRIQNKDTPLSNELPEFVDQPSLLKGYSIHTRLSKGPRGFGFNIVGGSRPREFLQVYSVTPGGPPALNTADILVYINDSCVLGRSHKEVVELLKGVPMGQSVDVVLRRGYPMLYNPDGCPKQSLNTPLTPSDPSSSSNQRQGHSHLTYSRTMDNGSSPGQIQTTPPFLSQPITNGLPPTPTSSDLPLAPSLPDRVTNHSDGSDGGPSNSGTRRSSLIGYNSGTLPALSSSSLLQHQSSKSSESDLSTSTLPLRTSGSSQALGRMSRPNSGPQPTLSSTHTPPNQILPTPAPSCGFNGCPANHHHQAAESPGPSPGSGSGGGSGGELVPVAVGGCGGGGLGFSVTAGGHSGQLAVVRRVWDRRNCPGLQAGDTIVKINGADVQSLNFAQVQRVLQDHTKQGEVVLLVYRAPGSSHSTPTVTPNLYKPLPHSDHNSHDAMVPPLSQAGVGLESPPPTTNSSAPPAVSPNGPSVLIQSTSFLDSVPVTLTLEPRDLQGLDESLRVGGSNGSKESTESGPNESKVGGANTLEVELMRRQGEGFGFVIASQENKNGAGSLMSHRFVTVRRGSPAARSGHIQPGDHLEGVEGRPVGGLQHRDLAQILRRAGNTLRLTIAPRHNSPATEGADLDIDGRVIRSSRSRAKEEGRFYSVDLERGPTGFGFSLRGGSEYNMGLYVLGLMQGGPAQRSNKIQVSDQLVEINGDSTAGMTHSQAVDQIRRGGNHIHLVLKRGNGYVPDYGPEEGALSPSTPPPQEPDSIVAAASTTIEPGGGREGERSTKRNREETRARPRPIVPDLDLDTVDQEPHHKSQKHRKRSGKNQEEERRGSESLPRNRVSSWDEKGVGKNKEEEESRRTRSVSRNRAPSLDRNMTEQSPWKHQEEQGRSTRSVSRNRATSWGTSIVEEGVVPEVLEKKRRSKRKEADNVKMVEDRESKRISEPFSFLMPRDEHPPSDSESAASFSEVSQSAASIAWREDSDWRRADSNSPPGRWLKPSPQKLSRVLIGSRLNGHSLVGGLSL